MNNCPICSSQILRHINHHQIYWYCPHCHQTVPNFTQVSVSQKVRQEVRDVIRDHQDQSVRVKVSC